MHAWTTNSEVSASSCRLPPSEVGRARLLSLPREPLFLAGWRDVVMLHFAVGAVVLQAEVPFAVETFEGRAFVSLVCFTLTDMRPRWGGAVSAALFRPVGTHRYLNVRTYVRHADEPGIHFLMEWLSSRVATWLGPALFGLPFRFGEMDYANGSLTEGARSRVKAKKGQLVYQCAPATRDDACPTGAASGSLDEFLLERYTAFAARRGWRGFFRVWHPPWQARRMVAQVGDRSLLENVWPWFQSAELVAAHHSPGFDEVWMGWPHELAAEAR